MKKGYGGGFGGGVGGGMNMQQMVAQAQKMQQDMAKAQENLKDEEVTATVGGGTVTVIATADKMIKSITIKPEVVDADDVEMLQDLVLAAVNEALNLAENKSREIMGKVTGGVNVPGLF